MILSLVAALGWGCGGGAETKPEPKPLPKLEASDMSTPPVKEPDRITVAHVLISFAGAGTEARRSKAEAEKLANDVLARAKKGEDFDKMMKDLSDDTGGGVYSMTNTGVKPSSGDEYPRKGMVAAFGDVGFKLEVGGVGMSTFDPKTSPYGWHVIKRLK